MRPPRFSRAPSSKRESMAARSANEYNSVASRPLSVRRESMILSTRMSSAKESRCLLNMSPAPRPDDRMSTCQDSCLDSLSSFRVVRCAEDGSDYCTWPCTDYCP